MAIKKKKVVEYQIDEEDAEVVRKAIYRHSDFRGDALEALVKKLRTEFHAEYTRQGNFTICVLISDEFVVPGVAKRCPTDEENLAVGYRVALSKAVKRWLEL